MDPLPLSDEDRAILDLEGPLIAGHTCKVIVVAAPAPSLEQVRARVERGLAGAPALRCRLGEADGVPAWVDAGPPDLEARVVAVDCPPLDNRSLRELVSRLFAERLDRAGPLWRIDAAPLEGERLALIWRIHHALADGSTAMRLAEAILWDETDGPATGAPSGAPSSSRPPAAHHDEHDERRRRAHLAAFLTRELGEELHRSPFDGPIGTSRAVAFGSLALHDLHDAAKQLANATLNDAVLASVGGGIRRWVGSGRKLPHKLRVRVPVSLHKEGDAVANRDSFFTLPIDVHEPDAVRRLEQVSRREAVRKQDHDAEQLEVLEHELGRHHPNVEHALETWESSPRSFALAVSNVRGPARPIAVCGSPVEEIYSLAEIGLRHGLRVAAVSLGDRLYLGLCADPVLVPDLADLAAGIEAEAAELIGAARAGGEPGS